jgi:hypothetical protein
MNDEEKQRHYALAEKLLSEQNFAAAVIVGFVATLLAAVTYGIIVATWPFSYGFAAAGIGIAIGVSMGFLGRGISMKFSAVAAGYTIIGCLLGNLFRAIVERVRGTGTSPIDLLGSNSLSTLAEWSVSYISLIDFVYWFIAIFAAVFLARRPLSRAQRLAIGMLELRA